MDMTCELSSIVFETLYAQIADDNEKRSVIFNRLEELQEPSQVLDLMIDKYRCHSIKFGDRPLSADHARFANWLIAPLRKSGKDENFFNEFSRTVISKTRRRGFENRAPSFLQPRIIAWCLARVESDYVNDLPLTLASSPIDPDIARAYLGLNEHLKTMLREDYCWPELSSNAILWRLNGIVEALARCQSDGAEDYGPKNAYRHLSRTYEPVLPIQRLRGWKSFGEVVDHRNVLTHLGPENELTFREAAALATEKSEALDRFAALTRIIVSIVCAHVAWEQENTPRFHGPGWDTLQWDLFDS